MQYKPAEEFDTGLNTANDGLAHKADRLVHEVGSAAMDSGKSVIENLKHKSEDVGRDLKTFSSDGAAIIRKRVENQPFAALGIALATGAVVSGLMFRR